MISPEPYELAYMADLKRLLEQIRATNGFHTDAGEHVFASDERVDPDPAQAYQIILLDPEEELVKQDGYVRDLNLRLEAEIWVRVASGPDGRLDARTLARRVVTDVRHAVLLGTKNDSWQKRPAAVTLEGRSLPVIETGSQWQYANQPVILQVREEYLEL